MAFTIKLYTRSGGQLIFSAVSFHILRHKADAAFEVTTYGSTPDFPDRYDVGPTGKEPAGGNWDWGFIVNESGKTVEALHPSGVDIED